MQKKKVLVVFVLAALALCSTSAFAGERGNVLTPCSVNGSNGLAIVPQVVAVGSSAQFNTAAYAAAELLTAEAGDTGINTADYNLYSTTTGVTLNDNRFSTTLSDTANPTFIMWDNATTCNVYAYFETDSGIGVKDFFSTIKFIPANQTGTPKTYDVAGVTVAIGTTASASAVPGLPDNATSLPSAIKNYFNTPWVPIYGTTGTTHVLTNAPLAMCGSTTTAPTSNGWCTFNMAATDIRPEDALYAFTRALSTLTATTYTGLGYNQSGCLGGTISADQGCPIFDSFKKGKVFNVLKFALSGSDPVTSATVPPYTTINAGASPQLVLVENADSAGFGAMTGTNYTINNVHRAILAQVFSGTLHCTGDFLPGFGGAGQPIQEIQREPVSGTYNTFEFTAVRTLLGSSNGATSAASATAWPSNDDRGMETNVNPATGFNTSACGFTSTYALGDPGLTATPNGTTTCGDPIFIKTGSGGGCGQGIRARSVGSGEEVAAALGLDGSTGGVAITDGIGFTFWSYGNLGPAATGCGTSTNQTTYNGDCSFIGHYLTVDGIDPLFATAGGANDSPPNPAGAFNPPQCNFNALPCFAIPFTHVKDGTYPLWSVLRNVTFSTSTSSKIATPPAVLKFIAYEEYEASTNNRLSDFVPFLNSVNTTATPPTGDLNLGVYRTHFHQTNNPVNGFVACHGTYTGIALGAGAGTCGVDAGGDVGGAVMPIQADIDFNADFGSMFGTTDSYELYDQHQ